MSIISISRCHELNETRRQRAFEELSVYLSEVLGAAVTRQAWVLEFKGKGLAGTVTLGESHVECDINLGVLRRPLKSVITRKIEVGLTSYLDDAGH